MIEVREREKGQKPSSFPMITNDSLAPENEAYKAGKTASNKKTDGDALAIIPA